MINVHLGQYIPADSFVHKLDPRAKLFGLIFMLTAIFMTREYFSVVLWAVMLVFIVRASKISLRVLLKSSRPVLYLVIFTFIFNLFMSKFSHAIFMSARLFILMLYALLLPMTTAPLELADGIDSLLTPFEKIGFPAHESSMMIGLAMRFIPLLAYETDNIIKAQLSRGARLDQGNLFQRVKSFFPVLIPLFVIIFRRADEIALAMTARGYNPKKLRTRRKPLIWKFRDSLVLIFCALVSVIFIYM